jgi:hypothetical protein
MQEPLRHRLRELAATHVRYRYRRLTVLLRREGWPVNAKVVHLPQSFPFLQTFRHMALELGALPG